MNTALEKAIYIIESTKGGTLFTMKREGSDTVISSVSAVYGFETANKIFREKATAHCAQDGVEGFHIMYQWEMEEARGALEALVYQEGEGDPMEQLFLLGCADVLMELSFDMDIPQVVIAWEAAKLHAELTAAQETNNTPRPILDWKNPAFSEISTGPAHGGFETIITIGVERVRALGATKEAAQEAALLSLEGVKCEACGDVIHACVCQGYGRQS